MRCLQWGVLASFVSLGVLGWRLRKGAPVLPERAGLMAGIASGAVGSVAITLECNNSELLHLAIAHVGIVAIAATIGRFALPRIIRW